MMPLLLLCRTVCGQRGWLLVTKSVCINWILFFKVWLICLGLLSSGDHFVGCQTQNPAHESLRSLAWLIKVFFLASITLPCLSLPGHGQRGGGQVPNGRSFCIPSNEGAVGQFGPGAKALNARFESKLFVNFVNARFKVKVACHFASFYSFVRIHCQFCERPFSLSQSCPGLCAQEPGQRPSVEARLWHGYAPARGDLSTRPFEGLLARVFNSSDGSTLMRVSKPCFTPIPCHQCFVAWDWPFARRSSWTAWKSPLTSSWWTASRTFTEHRPFPCWSTVRSRQGVFMKFDTNV